MSEEQLIVSRTAFEEAGKKQHKQPSVITRAWHSTVLASAYMGPGRKPNSRYNPEKPDVDFRFVMAAVRHLETGESHAMWLGKTAWNIIADINNHDKAASDPDYLIPWTPAIHNNFRNGPERRARAAEQLQSIYRELGHMTVGDTVLVSIPPEA